MKKYILILFCVFNTLCYSQTLDDLMKDFDNLYALEHIELFTKEQHKIDDEIPLPFSTHRSIKIVGVDSIWLTQITKLIKENPNIINSYLDSKEKNLAAYILLMTVFEIDLPPITNNTEEGIYINNLKRDVFNDKEVNYYTTEKDPVPSGENPAKYMLNSIWLNIASEANQRLKAAVEAKTKD
ncbi:hypothetical protein [Wenyingzhuangia sp. IMCC45574]